MNKVYGSDSEAAVAYTSVSNSVSTNSIKPSDPDEIGRYRSNREEVEKRKKRDSLYLVLSSFLDLMDTALILFLLIFLWNMEYYGLLLAGIILSIGFVGCKVAFAVLVYKKRVGFWSKPWSPFLMDVVSAFVPGCVIPLFVMAAATGYLPNEVNCSRTELEWAVGIICIAKVAESGAYGGLAWLTDLCTGRGCLCVCDLFDCSDCSLERACEYFLRTVCDKLIVSLRILCALLVLIFGIIKDFNIADICIASGSGNTTLIH